MSYYRLLGLDKEPFSTSPDPAFFYLSPVHGAALYRLRINVALKRGLSVVVGDIGTGKTTLTRRLSQIFYEDPQIDFHAILNPLHQGDADFLHNLLKTFRLDTQAATSGSVEALHAIEKYLFHKAVEEQKTVVLLIDEAQQLTEGALEILRALLNYETSEHKLLQVILVGQMELAAKLHRIPNFWDRISAKIKISPLDEKAMREMIRFRLQQANYSRNYALFTPDALREIYLKTFGLPRRAMMLCHDALEYLIMSGQHQIDRRMIRKLYHSEEALLATH